MSDKPKIVWAEPPPQARGPGKWTPILAELRSNPGRWALLTEGAHSGFATTIRQGKVKGAEPGEFEATNRSNGEGRFDVFARYVGNGTGAQ